MPAFSTTRDVPFTVRQMYDLVADVERYPEFLPLCEALAVTGRERSEGREVLTARMSVGYGAIRESFTSRVTLDPATPGVFADYVDGPFRHMENRWHFTERPGGCTVHFAISYEFKSVLLQMLAGAVFEQAFRRFAEAFENRARQVYGAPPEGQGAAAPSHS
ncbi:MAG: type II toxin-antitoxin system RatA family toxin [Hyphomicrobiaceae bacterium]